MHRGRTGRIEAATFAGEQVRAFVLHPLPPEPRLDLAGRTMLQLELAHLALGRLDCVTRPSWIDHGIGWKNTLAARA